MAGWYRTAVAMLEATAKKYPNDALVSRDLGRTYLLGGNTTGAIEMLERAKALGGSTEIVEKELNRARQVLAKQIPK
jgi:hypothetical protein